MFITEFPCIVQIKKYVIDKRSRPNNGHEDFLKDREWKRGGNHPIFV